MALLDTMAVFRRSTCCPRTRETLSRVLEQCGVLVRLPSQSRRPSSNKKIGCFLFPDWTQRWMDAVFVKKKALFVRYASEGLREMVGMVLQPASPALMAARLAAGLVLLDPDRWGMSGAILCHAAASEVTCSLSNPLLQLTRESPTGAARPACSSVTLLPMTTSNHPHMLLLHLFDTKF